MNAFMLYWRDASPLTLGNGRTFVSSVICPLSANVKTKCDYVRLFGGERIRLESLGFLAKATTDFKEAASLQLLTSATLEGECQGCGAGDFFVEYRSKCSAVRKRLVLTEWDDLLDCWIPVSSGGANPTLGWVRAACDGDAEGVFVGRAVDLDFGHVEFLFRKSKPYRVFESATIARWSNA